MFISLGDEDIPSSNKTERAENRSCENPVRFGLFDLSESEEWLLEINEFSVVVVGDSGSRIEGLILFEFINFFFSEFRF